VASTIGAATARIAAGFVEATDARGISTTGAACGNGKAATRGAGAACGGGKAATRGAAAACEAPEMAATLCGAAGAAVTFWAAMTALVAAAVGDITAPGAPRFGRRTAPTLRRTRPSG
jgi:hypothetical protein